MTRSWSAPRRGVQGVTVRAVAASLMGMSLPTVANAQVAPDSTAQPPAEASAAVPVPSLPGFLTVGLGFGQRFDPCAQCASPENTSSFTGHLSVGKYLLDGIAIGVDVSAWRRGHPGTPLGADSVTAGTPVSLVNQLANVSLVASLDTWHVFVRGGVGVAMGQQDVQDAQGEVAMATGMGVGYTVGGGITLPLASVVSLAFFANYNAGSYDLSTPTAVLERGVKHELVELGFGLTIR